LPHEEAAQREYFKEGEEDLRLDHEANRVAKAGHKRPWWKFWLGVRIRAEPFAPRAPARQPLDPP
jgi:hypothetical protein